MELLELLREPIISQFIGNESQFESNIIEHLEEICGFLDLPGIKAVHRQRQIRANGFQIIIDIIVRHIDDTVTIFEVKKVNSKNPTTGTYAQVQGIGQLLLYQNMYKAKTNVNPRLVLIDNKIYERTLFAFSGHELPITLVEFQKDRVFIPYRGW